MYPKSEDAEKVYAGIDVAGPGSDETIVTIVGEKGGILETKSWTQPDPRGPVVEFLNRWRDRLKQVRIDSAGIGWNFFLHLRDQPFPVDPINVGEASSTPERFINKKAELYWNLREAPHRLDQRALRPGDTTTACECALRTRRCRARHDRIEGSGAPAWY
jgi:hypothetical protein